MWVSVHLSIDVYSFCAYVVTIFVLYVLIIMSDSYSV